MKIKFRGVPKPPKLPRVKPPKPPKVKPPKVKFDPGPLVSRDRSGW